MPSGSNIAGGAIAGAGAGMQVGGPYGAIAGAVIGGVLGALMKTPTLTLEKYSPTDVSRGQIDFLSQGKNIAGVSSVLSQANQIDNASYQKDASEFAPNLMGNLKQQGANTSSLLNGQLSAGVQSALGKPGATARDLGLTSDQLMQQGASQLGGEVRTAASLNPFNETATSTLLSPAALLQRRDQNDMYNLNIRNQQHGADFANAASNDWASQAMGMLTSMSPTGGASKGIMGAPAGQGYGYTAPSGSMYGGGGAYDTLYGFNQGDTGPTADSMFDPYGNYNPYG